MNGLGMSDDSEWVASLVLKKTTWFMSISNMQKNVFWNSANMITNLNFLKCKYIIPPPPRMYLWRTTIQAARWITLGEVNTSVRDTMANSINQLGTLQCWKLFISKDCTENEFEILEMLNE